MENRTSSSKEWIYRENVNREDLVLHAPYEPEMEFYNAVKSGDTAKVKTYLKQDFTSTPGLGRLSDNDLRNFRYHFIPLQ